LNWSTAASIADVISALAVVVSLFYVSLQIRANTRSNKATAFHATIDSEMGLAKMVVEHAGTWDKVMNRQPLAEGEETRRAIAMFNFVMLDAERRFNQFNAGFLEAGAWEGNRNSLPLLVALPLFERWRTSYGALSRSADFLRLLDEIAERAADKNS
jgi:hypothetical protein